MSYRQVKVMAANQTEALSKAVDEFNRHGHEVSIEDLFVQEQMKSSLKDRLTGKGPYIVAIKEAEETGTKEEELHIDGYCGFRFGEEEVFLKVYAPQGKGTPVHLNVVEKEIEKRELEHVDWDTISQKLREGEEDWFPIAPRQKELDRDARVELEVSKDGLTAYLNYDPPLGGSHYTLEGLKDFLQEKGIVHGLLEAELLSLVGSTTKRTRVKVAQGTKPIPGKDGYLEYRVGTEEEKKGKMREDGSIDYLEKDHVINVKEGEVLVEAISPVPGVAGTKVTGEEIPPKEGRPAKLPKGKNVRVSEDGQTLMADVDGQFLKRGERIDINPILHVQGDVDLSTGNLDFLGTIVVNGSVTEGLKVKAGGDVEVRGNVNSAEIQSQGAVRINKGFKGGSKGLIKAMGDVQIRFVENGTVVTQGDLQIGEAIMHSTIDVGGSIVVGGKGLIVGGRICCKGTIEANTIGSALATKTEIFVGVDPLLRQEEEEKVKQYKDFADNLIKVNKALKILKDHDKKGVLNQARKEQLNQLLETKSYLEKEVDSLEKRLQAIRVQKQSLRGVWVKAKKKLYPGTFITIADYRRKMDEEWSRVKVYYDEDKDEVVLGTL